jgi:hypothetical protein
LRLQNDQRGGLRAFSVDRRGDIPSHCVANVWLAHDLFAGLHLDDANAQGRANHGGHAGAVGIKDAAIRTGSGRVSLRAPLLAGGHGRRSGRRQRHVGAWFEVLGYGRRRLAEARYHWLGLFESLDTGGDVLQVRCELRRWLRVTGTVWASKTEPTENRKKSFMIFLLIRPWSNWR